MKFFTKDYLKELSLSKQIRLIFILISLFIVTLLLGSFIFISSSQQEFNKAYNQHALPLKDLNEIRNIFGINILDTINEMNEGHISQEDAKEVLILANKLLSKAWYDYKSKDHTHVKNSVEGAKKEKNFVKLQDILNNLIEAMELENNQRVQRIISENLYPHIITINNHIDDLLEEDIENIKDTITLSEKNFKNLTYFILPLIVVGIIIFIKYIRTFLLNIQTISIELKELNENLEQKVQERTKEQESLLSLFEKGDSVLFRWNNDEVWSVDYVSSNVCNLMGYDKEDFLNNSVDYASCIHKDDLEQVIKEVEDGARKNHDFNKHKPYRIITKEGKTKWVLEYNALIKNEKGETVYFLGYILDITANHEIQKELEKQKEAAEAATKAKSYFLANMSHEIRTPMNGILGMSYLALKTELDEKQRNYLNKINDSANTLLGIINDILDISKIEAGKLQIEKSNFDLFKTIESVINLIEIKANEKRLDVVVDYYPEIGKDFYGDSLRINQILVNLLSNAVKFTDDGEIGLVVKYSDDSKRIRFEISDTGIGMTEEQIKRVFESFTQADATTTKKYGGTGLGLSITKQLVELMNGNVNIKSELGVGTTFIFEIELQPLERTQQYTIFKGKKALVVDDCQSWLGILDHLMHSFGLEIDMAHSGKEAIEILRNEPDKYDLILIDWNMPELDGIETCKIIHNELHIDTKKIILISAYTEVTLAQGIKEAKIDRYIHKPINPSILNDMLNEIFLGKINSEKIEKTNNKNHLHEKIKTLKGSKILLAEDNEINQEIIIDLLAESGIIIDIASNGFEAFKKVEENEYELILMDIQMPILDGYKATQMIREKNRTLPIIALTANAMKEDVIKTKDVGMNKHLNKPIEIEKLFETLLEFIPQKVKMKEQLEILFSQEEDTLPDFETIDKKYALKLLLGNEKAFLTILKGLLKYKDIAFETLDNDEVKRVFHSLKGLSASAGAKELSKLAEEIEQTLDTSLVPLFEKKFALIINELESKLFNIKVQKKEDIPKEKRDRLFKDLKEAVASKKIKRVQPLIKEIETCNLNQKDAELFQEIKKLVENYKFKQAMVLFS